MTHELEARFNLEAMGQEPLPLRSVEEAAGILLDLSKDHDFTFYKYQMSDLISHTGRVELARGIFELIETFVAAILDRIDPAETVVIVTSDHGHLEQVGFTRGHPKSKVPTWYFGPNAEVQAQRMHRPEGIFRVAAEFGEAAAPLPR
jgi:2,3-bisphosphoglycerate-independent phosphoglycerate mutase